MRCPRAERAGSNPIAWAAVELPTALPRPAHLSDYHAMPWTDRLAESEVGTVTRG